ncbi:MAG: alanine dehydrogenase [Bacteroidetes bacterium]|nr:MAG: alanine dehydrogenase [Bacteroidota bacterium]
MKIGILREGKNPPDKRVALLPKQCKNLMTLYPNIEFIIQKSEVRHVKDEEYLAEGLKLKDDLSECTILFGVKEVPIDMLMPNRTYFFFSHTIKKQIYNQKLLQNILEKNIRLIDYECLTDNQNNRLVAFGRFAGLVGAYNGLRTWGIRTQSYEICPAHHCKNLLEVYQELDKLKLTNIKIALTGTGRVGKGAIEILQKAKIRQVTPQEYLLKMFNEPVFTVLESCQYYQKKFDAPENADFYENPELFDCDFLKFANQTDILITAHFWHTKAAALFTQKDILDPNFHIKVIADITCDVGGSIPSTLKASTIAEPVYDYNPTKQCIEPAFSSNENINVMAIDNLPGELPFDASESFGEQIVKYVFPALFGNGDESILDRATITKNGRLTADFEYLSDYALVKEKI